MDEDAARRHLTEARNSLSAMTQLPAAGQLQGEARTQVSQLITNFNELITTQSNWRASYTKVNANLTALLGPDPAGSGSSAATAGTAAATGTAGDLILTDGENTPLARLASGGVLRRGLFANLVEFPAVGMQNPVWLLAQPSRLLYARARLVLAGRARPGSPQSSPSGPGIPHYQSAEDGSSCKPGCAAPPPLPLVSRAAPACSTPIFRWNRSSTICLRQWSRVCKAWISPW